MRHWQVASGMKVGVVGLGGLGHMGVKFAHAMGAHTVMVTTSPTRRKTQETGSRGGLDLLRQRGNGKPIGPI